jgi:4-hydroxybenzoate polyprenyltransferase
MALNDYADRDADAAERPGRPIPAGRISPEATLGLGIALTASGLALARLADPRRAGVAASLAAVVWAYDFWLKSTPAGPVAMSAARMLNVQLGADPARPAEAAVPAVAIAAHTYLVTTLSRHEVTGTATRAAVPLATTAGTVLIALAAGLRRTPAGPRLADRLAPRLAQTALALAYAGLFGLAQAAAVRDGSPRRVKQAVASGILALIPLQGALAAGQGAPAAALAVASLSGAAWPLFRRVSPT